MAEYIFNSFSFDTISPSSIHYTQSLNEVSTIYYLCSTFTLSVKNLNAFRLDKIIHSAK